ncbi:large subunit ribosomal protein L24e, partial [Phenoliferia sp. Uapishka_3]
MSPPLLCLTCSSTLDSLSLPTHSNSEKFEPPPLLLPCGVHSVCGRCQRQRQLATSCILCESVLDSSPPATKKRGAKPASSSNFTAGSAVAHAGLPSYEEVDDFVIGDEDDDEGAVGETEKEGPPAYGEEAAQPAPAEKGGEDMSSGQMQVHYLRPEETLLGLSMKYRESGQLLCRLNKLPLSTLSTTPHLLHTLPFLLLPPTSSSASSSPLHPPFLERRRLILRRFQVHTRCSDWAMANFYVSAIFRERDAEYEMVKANRVARGESVEGLGPREGDELEEAIAAYEKDQKWEDGQKGKGKMGSKIRSTGQVEREVKGWGWNVLEFFLLVRKWVSKDVGMFASGRWVVLRACTSMKRNPRKLKWTKAFRKAAGKEMTVDSTLTFEKRRNVPIVYDRDLVQATIAGMRRIGEIRAKREKAFYKARMAAAAPATLVSDGLEVTRSSHLLSLLHPTPHTKKALSASSLLLAARAEKKAARIARGSKKGMEFDGGAALGDEEEASGDEESESDEEVDMAEALAGAEMSMDIEEEVVEKVKVKSKAKGKKTALKKSGGGGMGMSVDA